MEDSDVPHERVRFRKADIAALESLPSAAPSPHFKRRRKVPVLLRALAIVAFSVVAIAVIGAGTLYFAGTAGLGNERLKREAEAALSAYIGAPISVEAGAARFSLGETGLVAIEIPSVRLSMVQSGREFARAGALRFGFEVTPLLSGRIEVSDMALRDAVIDQAAIPAGERPGWLDGVSDERGIVDPDAVVAAAFDGVKRLFAALDGREAPRIVLRDVELAGASGETLVRIGRAAAWRETADRLRLEGDVEALARTVALEGTATRRPAAGSYGFDIQLDVSKAAEVPSGEIAEYVDGSVKLRLTGRQAPGTGLDRIRIAASSDDIDAALPDFDPQRVALDLSAVLEEGADKLEVERLTIGTQRSSFKFHGAVGPIPADDGEERLAGYRWEFNSDGSVVAASDVSERALPFLARIAGTYDPFGRLLSADEIGVRTRPGEIYGRATVQFVPGQSPAVALALDVPSMPVAHAKQLWPAPTAPGARAWVLKNVFGGTVKDSRIRFRVAAGRLGNGQSLDGEEVNGHFSIEDTRFDITGELPAVRDAFGTVDFRGADVDITLSSGTVYMPTGRTLAASNGTFLIREVESRPTTGFVDIDVAGDAPAVVEFASYRPIDAMRRLKLEPEDFAGQVKGNVKAEIPLRDDFPIEELDWEVDLAYENMSIAQPFEGQQVTDANGTIDVDPDRAVIKASARLNGVPATVEMTEPLSETGPQRDRAVALVLDDAARARIAPGLNEMLSGPVSAEVEILESGGQRMSVDLRKAELTFPWIGWTKGKGVAGTASFVMAQDGDRITLSDFSLEGETFQAKGEIEIAGGELAGARFSQVSLNRGDDVSFAIRRTGKGYDVDIDGSSLDARSIIKLYLSETEKAEKAVESVPITLDAKVDRMIGFYNEAFTNVTVALSGTGTDLGTLGIAATATAGAAVNIANETSTGGRSVSIRSADAGAVLRFLNIYEYMQGGSIYLALAAQGQGPLRGQIEARDFWLVNDPKLKSIISAPQPEGDYRTLGQVVRRDIDDRKARFQRGFALVEKGEGYLSIDRGVLRGVEIGATFQGTLYDTRGNIDVTGTFMPAYGVNRLFGEIPLFGQILGNGRDRGLIGITFRLAGDTKSPQLQVNPMSVIAPGIFRSIFEFN